MTCICSTELLHDGLQGTAATAVAGLYGAMKVKGLPKSALKEQRFVVAGAGSAGMGVVRMICQGARLACREQHQHLFSRPSSSFLSWV